MEPFFIFCAILVLYSGYLTAIDLLRDLAEGTSPAPTVRHAVESVGRTIRAGHQGSWDRIRAGAGAGQFPTLSRGAL
jgi:hypothetical protein